MNEKELIDFHRGPLTKPMTDLRIFAEGFSGFGIYKPLEDRLKLVMNNIASNTEIFGIDSSVLKANEKIDVNGTGTI